MRLFVGIEFPDAVLDALVQCQETLRGYTQKGRFKRPENFHITLKFLGEVPDGDIAKLAGPLKNAADGLAPFNLSLGRLGQFGGGSPIRVVWLDVAGEVEKLRKLQAQVEQQLAPVGHPPENRPWRPHITLAQDVVLAAGAPAWSGTAVPPASFTVTEFALILSEERDRRRVYTPISRFGLER
jgi:2'-5' RNA ligase